MKYKLAETDIYDFAGWLTTREGVMKVGSSSDASLMSEAVGEYIKKFPNRFSAAQKRNGLTEQQIKYLLSDSACWIGDDCSMPNLTYIIRAVEKAHGIGEK